tara:strand:- start:4135 stop:5430 length:1296 start_codon:yes stop_codon:yes gene_type:complete
LVWNQPRRRRPRLPVRRLPRRPQSLPSGARPDAQLGFPTITVRIAFSSDWNSTAPIWTDISSDVVAFNTRRGRQFELNRIEAGLATIVLENSSGDYWPDNTGGAHTPNVLPGKRVQIRATYGSPGVIYDVFTGFIEAWDYSFPMPGSTTGAMATITAVDGLKQLAMYEINATSYSEEASGTRVDNVLTTVGWPAGDRDIDAGQSAIQSSGTLNDTQALSHLDTVLQSELGVMFVNGHGDMVFHDRHARLLDPLNVSQATYGDDSSELPYHDISFRHDDQTIYNDIRITRKDGAEQSASDSDSQNAYGERNLDRESLLMTTDAVAADFASHLLRVHKDGTMRVKSMTVLPERDRANEYPDVLTFDISTRITVRLNATSVDEDYIIEGVSHSVTASPQQWQTVWDLSPAETQSFWTLGIVGLSEVGTSTYLSF